MSYQAKLDSIKIGRFIFFGIFLIGGAIANGQEVLKNTLTTTPTSMFTGYNGSYRFSFERQLKDDISVLVGVGKVNGWSYRTSDSSNDRVKNSGLYYALEVKKYYREGFWGIRLSRSQSDYLGMFLYSEQDPPPPDGDYREIVRVQRDIKGIHAIGGVNAVMGNYFVVQPVFGLGLSHRNIAYDGANNLGNPVFWNSQGAGRLQRFLLKETNGYLPTIFFQVRCGFQWGR